MFGLTRVVTNLRRTLPYLAKGGTDFNARLIQHLRAFGLQNWQVVPRSAMHTRTVPSCLACTPRSRHSQTGDASPAAKRLHRFLQCLQGSREQYGYHCRTHTERGQLSELREASYAPPSASAVTIQSRLPAPCDKPRYTFRVECYTSYVPSVRIAREVPSQQPPAALQKAKPAPSPSSVR